MMACARTSRATVEDRRPSGSAGLSATAKPCLLVELRAAGCVTTGRGGQHVDDDLLARHAGRNRIDHTLCEEAGVAVRAAHTAVRERRLRGDQHESERHRHNESATELNVTHVCFLLMWRARCCAARFL